MVSLAFRHKVANISNEANQNKTNQLLVYTMGKVGSTSVTRALIGLGFPVVDIHQLNHLDEIENKILNSRVNPLDSLSVIKKGREIRNLIERSTEPWNIISMVRDPVALNVSSFFQALHEFIPNVYERIQENSVTIDELTEIFFTNVNHNLANDWFDRQFQPVFDLDIFVTPFNSKQGYQIYGNSRCQLLIMRLMDLDEVFQPAMKEFLRIENAQLPNENIGANKYYASLYSAFKKAGLPSSYIHDMYSTRFAQHFFTQEELKNFGLYWAKKN